MNNIKPIIKVVAPALILLIVMSGFSFIYSEEREQIEKGESNISLSYRYYFVNKGPLNLTTVSIRLALLKSWEPYQIVNSIVVNTPPNRTTTDVYDNKFVWYEYTDVKIGEVIDLKFDVNITLKFMDYTSVVMQSINYDKDDTLYKLYSKFDSLTDTTDPKIIDVANRIKASSTDDMNMIFNVYNFTSNYLRYKLLSKSRGASFAINNGYGDCDEYQNLFIALVRALGIPAIGHTAWLGEFIPGTSTTDAGAYAHAFPMFYIPSIGLISADPTRGANSVFDNWVKTDDQRITMTQGPDQPYRLLNYKWVPVEGLDNPSLFTNYTISVFSSETVFNSKVRSLVLSSIITIPLLFTVFNIGIAKKVRKERAIRLEKILNPRY